MGKGEKKVNKKSNTIIFMLIATLLNVVLLAVFFIAGFVLLSLALNAWPSLANSGIAASLLTLIVFIGSIGLTFVIYNKIVMWANKKFQLEDKLYPFFSNRKRK